MPLSWLKSLHSFDPHDSLVRYYSDFTEEEVEIGLSKALEAFKLGIELLALYYLHCIMKMFKLFGHFVLNVSKNHFREADFPTVSKNYHFYQAIIKIFLVPCVGQ